MARFPTTRVSAVLDAGSGDAETRRGAWEVLAAAYYKPVYKHVRVRWRRSVEDAEDLTQAFFAKAVEKDFFRTYDPDETRFRTFVRVCLDRFVSDQDKAARRLKRGGGARTLSLDLEGAELELERAGPSAFEAPDAVFDREWSRSLLGLGVDAFRERCAREGRDELFDVFERYDLQGPEERPTYAELGRALGVPATTVTNRLATARRRFRAVVLEKLRELTASDEEYESEAERLLGSRPR